MAPIYKFTIDAIYNNTTLTRVVKPVWKDLAIDWAKDNDCEYFRKTLSGELKFIAGDYDWIKARSIETQFKITIAISYDGSTWVDYWTGEFYKTDCKFNDDDKIVSVTPSAFDEYTQVLAGLEKEFNLIDLAPEIVNVKLDKRPMYQIYSPGEDVVACFLSGMYWEQSANETEEANLGNYFFALAISTRFVVARILETGQEPISQYLWGDIIASPTRQTAYAFDNGAWQMWYRYDESFGIGSGHFYVMRNSDRATWRLDRTLPVSSDGTGQYTLAAYSGGATGNVIIEVYDKHLYSRMVLDVDSIGGVSTHDYPADDIVPNNRNYSKVVPFVYTDAIHYTHNITSTPSKYGIYQPGQYYQKIYMPANLAAYPIARTAWDEFSAWYTPPVLEQVYEVEGRKQYTLRDAYPLYSAISVILGKIAPGILHKNEEAYSRFLYGRFDPITTAGYKLLITPKSNILAGDYDQPAQKATVTLKMILDMLRDCFKCYWFIEKVGTEYHFRIEHILYFMNGGTYTGAPVVGIDLTSVRDIRTGKPWAFSTNKWTYDKVQMPERYEFSWMDDVTQLFEGYPIEIESKFVEAGNIEKVAVDRFTSDVDYMLLNPTDCDSDGFALLGAQPYSNNTYGKNLDVDGTLINDEDYCVSPYIDVSAAGMEVTYNIGANDGSGFLIEYDDDRQFVDFTANPTSGSSIVSLHASTKYVRFSMPTAHELTAWMVNAYDKPLYPTNDKYVLPYLTFQDSQSSSDIVLQNGYMAFYWLQQYYMYDLPASNIDADFYGFEEREDFRTKRQKVQEVIFPALQDVGIYNLIKTNLGNGQIGKISLNLSSRKATVTLNYDTEQ